MAREYWPPDREAVEDPYRVLEHTYTVTVATGGDFAVTRDRILKLLNQLKGFDAVNVEPAKDPKVHILQADEFTKILDSLINDASELRERVRDGQKEES